MNNLVKAALLPGLTYLARQTSGASSNAPSGAYASVT